MPQPGIIVRPADVASHSSGASSDPRRDCRIHSLYEKRNAEALHLTPYAAEVAAQEPPGHVNFV